MSRGLFHFRWGEGRKREGAGCSENPNSGGLNLAKDGPEKKSGGIHRGCHGGRGGIIGTSAKTRTNTDANVRFAVRC